MGNLNGLLETNSRFIPHVLRTAPGAIEDMKVLATHPEINETQAAILDHVCKALECDRDSLVLSLDHLVAAEAVKFSPVERLEARLATSEFALTRGSSIDASTALNAGTDIHNFEDGLRPWAVDEGV